MADCPLGIGEPNNATEDCEPLEQRQWDELHRQIKTAHDARDRHEARLRDLELNVKVMQGDVQSLRESRHESNNTLTGHGLAINELIHKSLNHDSDADEMRKDAKAAVQETYSMKEQMVQLRADVKHAIWLTGIIATAGMMVIQFLFKYIIPAGTLVPR